MATKAQTAPAVAPADDGSARALHALAVQRAAEHGERVAQAAADVQQVAAQLAALDRLQQAADAAVVAARQAVDRARADLVSKQAGAVIAAGASGEAEAVAAVQAAQAAFDASVRALSEAQASQQEVRAELDEQRDPLQDQHAEAKAAHSDLERLHGALLEHVAHAKDAAGREAVAEILTERAAIRARIRSALEQLEAGYADMQTLNESVTARMAEHPEHLADVRGPNGDRGPFSSWIEPRRQLCEAFDVFLAALCRSNGKGGSAPYIAQQMLLPEVQVRNAFAAGLHIPNVFAGRQRELGEVLVNLARISGEE